MHSKQRKKWYQLLCVHHNCSPAPGKGVCRERTFSSLEYTWLVTNASLMTLPEMWLSFPLLQQDPCLRRRIRNRIKSQNKQTGYLSSTGSPIPWRLAPKPMHKVKTAYSQIILENPLERHYHIDLQLKTLVCLRKPFLCRTQNHQPLKSSLTHSMLILEKALGKREESRLTFFPMGWPSLPSIPSPRLRLTESNGPQNHWHYKIMFLLNSTSTIVHIACWVWLNDLGLPA